ncbi:MAG: type II secretion system protein [Hydrogenophaga sp.]|uniref:type II secretion system protein n=1 Tax=Hydrogenophaga sp. TaxID=1904254 RepID=UPI003D102D3D
MDVNSNPPPSTPYRRRQAGGFLLELALVMLVVGVLTVSTFEVHSTMRQRQQTTDANNDLLSLDAALRTFVIREQRLPCPSAGGAGLEQTQLVGGRVAGCLAFTGEVPFLTLGMEMPPSRQGFVLRYGVAPALFSAGQALVVSAEAASHVSGDTSVPYVAGPDTQQTFGTCGVAAMNPAYALMWMPGPGSANAVDVPPLCFRENADQSMGFLAVGGPEFLGWLMGSPRP